MKQRQAMLQERLHRGERGSYERGERGNSERGERVERSERPKP